VIAIVNRKALEGDFNATAGIWRMKQLGERDKTEVHNTNQEVPITEEQLIDAVSKLNGEI